MKVAVVSFGTLGDIQPFLAFALSLRDAGYDAYLVAPSNFQSLAECHAVPFRPLSCNIRELSERADVKRVIESGSLLYFLIARKKLDFVMDQTNYDTWEATSDADAMVFRAGAPPAAFSIARKRGIPSVEVMYLPLDPSSEIAPVGGGARKTGGPLYNQLMGKATRLGFWRMFAKSANRFRRDRLNMPPFPFSGPYREYERLGHPTFYAFSPTVIPRPNDWRPDTHVVGNFYMPDPPGWAPPADLISFLEAGSKPVYIGFGSMPSSNPLEKARILLEGLSQTGHRAVFHAGWGDVGARLEFPPNVYRVGFVPFSWLFPRMSAVMHHGGAGTTAWALRAGVPMIIVPHNFDQPYWAARMHELGVAPPPVPFKQLSPKTVTSAIRAATTSQDLQSRATEVGVKVRAEDGLARAVQLFEQYVLDAKHSPADLASSTGTP